jgi:hypothetical protein
MEVFACLYTLLQCGGVCHVKVQLAVSRGSSNSRCTVVVAEEAEERGSIELSEFVVVEDLVHVNDKEKKECGEYFSFSCSLGMKYSTLLLAFSVNHTNVNRNAISFSR